MRLSSGLMIERANVRPEDIEQAEMILFPGVGSFGAAMRNLAEKGFLEPLRTYLNEDRPFFGICLGMQTLFEGSEESEGIEVTQISGRKEDIS